jgi:hypothetical protein
MMVRMIEYIIELLPFLIAFIVYLVRLETKLAKISQDLCWLKKEFRICRLPSDNPSP